MHALRLESDPPAVTEMLLLLFLCYEPVQHIIYVTELLLTCLFQYRELLSQFPVLLACLS